MFKMKVELVMWWGRFKLLILSGPISEGRVNVGDEVTIHRGPSRKTAIVKQIDAPQMVNLTSADTSSGYVSLSFEGLKKDDVIQGDWIHGSRVNTPDP